MKAKFILAGFCACIGIATQAQETKVEEPKEEKDLEISLGEKDKEDLDKSIENEDIIEENFTSQTIKNSVVTIVKCFNINKS